jgi:hypothetical protein
MWSMMQTMLQGLAKRELTSYLTNKKKYLVDISLEIDAADLSISDEPNKLIITKGDRWVEEHNRFVSLYQHYDSYPEHYVTLELKKLAKEKQAA